MSLLGWDDTESYLEETPDLIWKEYTVRVLQPRDKFGIEDAYHVDIMSAGMVGYPVKCQNECGRTALNLTPVGEGHYTLTNENINDRNPKGVYCPHCDGGEDIG